MVEEKLQCLECNWEGTSAKWSMKHKKSMCPECSGDVTRSKL